MPVVYADPKLVTSPYPSELRCIRSNAAVLPKLG